MIKSLLSLILLLVLNGCANKKVINTNDENLTSTTNISDHFSLDSDEDGINNDHDKCPNTNNLLKVNSDGCSLYQIDGDNDGVVNSFDKCINTPKDLSVNSIGCQNDFKGINFAFDSSLLTKSGIKACKKLIKYLDKYPEYNARIIGNTDSIGNRAYNNALAERRAKSTMKYLLSHQVKEDRLKIIPLGEDAPVKFNDLEEGRATNRRVDIIIVEAK